MQTMLSVSNRSGLHCAKELPNAPLSVQRCARVRPVNPVSRAPELTHQHRHHVSVAVEAESPMLPTTRRQPLQPPPHPNSGLKTNPNPSVPADDVVGDPAIAQPSQGQNHESQP